jgi:hypothetical protein
MFDICFFFLLSVFSFQSVVQSIFIRRAKKPHIRDPRQICGKVHVFVLYVRVLPVSRVILNYIVQENSRFWPNFGFRLNHT